MIKSQSISFNKESIKFTKPFYVALCVLEISEEVMYETYYDKKQPYSGEDFLALFYIGTVSFILSIKPIFDFGDLDPSHQLISEDNEKAVAKKKLEAVPQSD